MTDRLKSTFFVRVRACINNVRNQPLTFCPLAAIIQMIILSLTVLSVQPHQEPRFLMPLLLPIIVLIANTGRLAHVSKAFWVC